LTCENFKKDLFRGKIKEVFTIEIKINGYFQPEITEK